MFSHSTKVGEDQVQTGLNERVIEHGVLFAPGDQCEACHIGERRSCPILAVESEQGVCPGNLVGRERARDRSGRLSQFHAILPIAAIAKTAEPEEGVRLAHHGTCPHHLLALAASIARGAHVV